MISTALNLLQSVWNSLIPFWQTIWIFFLWQSVWKVVYAVQIQCRESWMLLMNASRPYKFLAAAILRFIYIKFQPRANNRRHYAHGLYNSMVDEKDGHIPFWLIMFTCTALRHAVLEWQKNQGVHPEVFKSKLKADRPARMNNFNHNNDGGKNASCWAATGCKMITSLGIPDICTFLLSTWNTLPECY